MITKVKIVSVRDFINLSLQGNLDLLKIKECISELSSINGLFIDYDLIIDTRGAEIDLKVHEFWYLAKDFASIIHSGSSKGFRAKIAVICPIEHFDNAKFFELCSLNRGLNIRSFTSFEELFNWIGTPSTIE